MNDDVQNYTYVDPNTLERPFPLPTVHPPADGIRTREGVLVARTQEEQNELRQHPFFNRRKAVTPERETETQQG